MVKRSEELKHQLEELKALKEQKFNEMVANRTDPTQLYNYLNSPPDESLKITTKRRKASRNTAKEQSKNDNKRTYQRT